MSTKINSLFESAFPEVPFKNAADFWNAVSQRKIRARYISPFAIILHQNGVYPDIGKGTWIGHFCIINGSQGLEIGENCEICCGVQIYTHTTHKRCTLGKPKEIAPVRIGNNVFIGANSIISKDCRISDHAMVAPLSFLKPGTHVPPYALYAGIPAIRKGDMRTRR